MGDGGFEVPGGSGLASSPPTPGPPVGSGLPPPPPPMPPRRSPNRWPFVALAIVVVAALAAVVAVMVLDDDQSPGAAGANGNEAVADALVAARELSDAIGVERDVAVPVVVGPRDILPHSNGDTATTRATTDDAIVAFQEAVAGLGSSGADAYAPVLDSVTQLGAIRGEVDAYAGARDITQFEQVALPLHERYSTVVAAVVDAHAQFSVTIDDPDQRRGAELHAWGVRQSEARMQLILWILASTLVGDQDPDVLTAVSNWSSTYEQSQDELARLADGTPYQSAADDLVAAVAGGAVLSAAEDVLTSGQTDVAALIDSLNLDATNMTWLDFANEVERTIRNG